jgi:hypothetical protein
VRRHALLRELLQSLQIAEQAAVGLRLPKPLGLLRQPELQLARQQRLVGIAGLRQRLAAQGPLLHQPVLGKQLLLLGRGEALPAQLLALVEQLLQAGQAGSVGTVRLPSAARKASWRACSEPCPTAVRPA